MAEDARCTDFSQDSASSSGNRYYKDRKPPTGSARKKRRVITNRLESDRRELEELDRIRCFISKLYPAECLGEFLHHGGDREDGEECVEIQIRLSLAQALRGPDRVQWLESLNSEHTKILASETWDEPTAEDLEACKRGECQIIPICIVVSKKRCGKFKARAVCLGNLEQVCDKNEHYAPAISQPANRAALINAAANGYYVSCWDIDAAFTQSQLPPDKRIMVRIPKEWRGGAGDSGLRRLAKWLYGLRGSPLGWYLEYTGFLKSIGFSECETSPGLFKRASKYDPSTFVYCAVYVDDTICTGAYEKEVTQVMDQVLRKYKGRPIYGVKQDDGSLYYDVNGCDLYYHRRDRWMRLCMDKYIGKLLAKYNMTSCAPTTTPAFDESSLVADDGVMSDFPYMECLGMLNWIAVSGRPDISQPLSVLARYASKPVTRARVTAMKKVMKFLAGTRKEGIRYSVERERQFEAIYADLLRDTGFADKDVTTRSGFPKFNLFSDASFASCCVTLRSTSGMILYMRGTPVIWKTARQTVRSYSTSESEFIAASDALVLELSAGFKTFFDPIPDEITPLWVDNQSAISVSKSHVIKEKSRHYALRHMRVRDASKRIFYCPTNLQKADGLTKVGCSEAQRALLLHHTYGDPVKPKKKKTGEDEEQVTTMLLVAKDW